MAVEDTLKQGIAALKAGRKVEARDLLSQVVKQEPHNEMAWLWLGGAVQTDKERRFCLERVLTINPQNDAARRALDRMLMSREMAGERPQEPAEPVQVDESVKAAPAESGEEEGRRDDTPQPTEPPLMASDQPRDQEDELDGPDETSTRRPSPFVVVGAVFLAVLFIILAGLFWALGTGALSFPLGTGKATATPTPTVQASLTLDVLVTPSPSFTPPPTWTPRDTITPQPTWTPRPSRTPRATYTSIPLWTPTMTVTPTISQPPTITPTLTVTPTTTVTPTATRASTWDSTPQITMPPTWTPRPTVTPAPGMTMPPTWTPLASPTPASTLERPPTWTPLPTLTPLPSSTATPSSEGGERVGAVILSSQ